MMSISKGTSREGTEMTRGENGRELTHLVSEQPVVSKVHLVLAETSSVRDLHPRETIRERGVDRALEDREHTRMTSEIRSGFRWGPRRASTPTRLFGGDNSERGNTIYNFAKKLVSNDTWNSDPSTASDTAHRCE